jgi:predicted Zn-dependent protease
MKRLIRRLLTCSAPAILAAGLVGCPVNPATGEHQLILISESQEIEMGREYSKQVEAQLGLYDNPQLQEYVSRIGLELASKSEKPNLPWSFKVVDDVVVNAFALPGGFIFVTRGILAHFNSEAELAGVLGHEIGHVTARHSAEQMSRAQMAQLGVGLGGVFVPEVIQYADLINAGLGILFLKFGRDDERQSDGLGFRYMQRAGYDPREMVEVFDMLGRVTAAAGGQGIPSWLSTHPDPGERQQRMERALAEAGDTVGGEVGRERYLQMINGLICGDNPRQGFFRGQTFMHPDLQLQLDFPPGWKTQNAPTAVVAISEQEDAIIQLSFGQGATAEEAARAFLSQEGITAGTGSSQPVHGSPARWSYWSATTEDGTQLAGLAAFIGYKGQVFEIMGYTLQAKLSSYDSTFKTSLGSFQQLTDRTALNVQPNRIQTVKLERAMTLARFNQRYPSTVDLATLALLNDVAEDATIPAGEWVKRVVAGSGPRR